MPLGAREHAPEVLVQKCLLEFLSATSEEINALCNRYEGLYRFAQLLEMLAEGIADGSISVPE